jgi:hypothetical protein
MHTDILTDLYIIYIVYIPRLFNNSVLSGVQGYRKFKNGGHENLDIVPNHFEVLPCYLPIQI